jgi:hypothetical protein
MIGNDLAIIVGMATVFGIVFTIFWRITTQMNAGCHKRIDRMQADLQIADEHCLNRIQDHTSGITNRVDDLKTDMHSHFTGLTTRIDALLLNYTKGNGKQN